MKTESENNQEFLEHWLGWINRQFPDYSPLTNYDWNRVRKVIIESSGMSDMLASQIATDYEKYRTSLIGWNVLCEETFLRLKVYEK